MEIITVQCPKCKGELHVKTGTEKLFCMYCRSEVILKKPEIEKPEVVVASVNHEFQAKLAIAKHHEELFEKQKMTFSEVLKSYDDVKLIGAHHWEYWHARATFFVEAGLSKAKEGDGRYKMEVGSETAPVIFDEIVLASKKAFIDSYTLWMDSAIKYADSNAEKLTAEKEKNLEKINDVLEEVTEHHPTFHEPFVPSKNTDSYDGCFWAGAIFFIIFIIMILSV